jgi:hypothetical protein
LNKVEEPRKDNERARRQDMSKYLKLTALIFLILGLASCSIRTPEIKGVVLDEETKQPVEGAWVHATLEIETRTIQGEVNDILSVDRPHTRTDKYGRFTVLPKKFKKPLPPVGFGTEVLAFRVGASTVDDKGGGFRYFGGDYRKHFGEGDGNPQKVLRKNAIELTIHVKPIVRTESESFSHLQSLYKYCLTGRFGVEGPAVEGGCDEWELDFAIAKHERYLERYKNPKIIEKPPYGVSKWQGIIHYSNVLRCLAHLYKRKGDYKKSLDAFSVVVEFDKKHDLSFHSEEHQREIKELQQKLKGVKK